MERRTSFIIGGCATLGLCIILGVVCSVLLRDLIPIYAPRPAYATPDELAYDTVRDWHNPDRDTIETLQIQIASTAYAWEAVLVGFAEDGEREVNVVVVSPSENDHWLAAFIDGSETSNGDFTAAIKYLEPTVDTDVAIYGQIYNTEITRITATWPDGTEREASISRYGYLFFETLTPEDGYPFPDKVTAYASDGSVISSVTMPPVETKN